MAGEDPELDGPGIGYMLAGGSDPSNTDPFAMEPAAGEEWVSTPPHMMILAPGGFDAADFATEPKQDEPYIMWDGTPYEHLMVPVVAMTADAEMGDADAELQNIMSSAPAGIIRNATILGNPAEDGGEMVVLQEGDSGWVCYADRLVSPGNDPACYDAMWEELFARGRAARGHACRRLLHVGRRFRREQHRSHGHRSRRGRGVDHHAPSPDAAHARRFRRRPLHDRPWLRLSLHHVGRHALRTSHDPCRRYGRHGDGRDGD